MHRLLTSHFVCSLSFIHRICCRSPLAIAAGLIGLILHSTALAQPANDNFINAQVIINASGTIQGSNVGATKEPGEPSIALNDGGASVWYRWTAPANLTITFQTVNSDFDTIMGVFTGNSVDALTS